MSSLFLFATTFAVAVVHSATTNPPVLFYDFNDLTETQSDGTKFSLELIGDATLDGSGNLNCNGGYARTSSNLDFGLTDHTLVVEAKFSTLEQLGSGLISIDSAYTDAGGYSHTQFDSIVYNEINQDKTYWGGSEGGRRTPGDMRPIPGATAESDTTNYVHMAIVYDMAGAGTYQLYRNGAAYGSPVRVSTWMDITADGGERVLFCLRHATTGFFAGSIAYGAVYDYALTATEIASVHQDGVASTDCAIMSIDKYLTKCSAAFPGAQDEISAVEVRVTALENTDIGTETLIDDLTARVSLLESHFDQLTSPSAAKAATMNSDVAFAVTASGGVQLQRILIAFLVLFNLCMIAAVVFLWLKLSSAMKKQRRGGKHARYATVSTETDSDAEITA